MSRHFPKTSKIGILFFVSFVIFECASLPLPDEMKAEVATYQLPKLPEDGKAIVYVVFPESWYKGIRILTKMWDKTQEKGLLMKLQKQ